LEPLLRAEQHRAFGGHVEQAVGAVEISDPDVKRRPAALPMSVSAVA
jgi:hypothetical protein